MFTNNLSNYLITMENYCCRSIEPLNWFSNWNLITNSNGSSKPPFLSA